MRAKDFINEVTGQLRISPTMARNATDNKCQIVVMMPPEEFLSLTSSPKHVHLIHQSALPLHKYNQFTKMGDDQEYTDFISALYGEKQYGSIVHPFLRVEFKDRTWGRVTGHEGRHRAAALIAKGGKKLPVAICLRDTVDNKEFMDKMGALYYMTSEHLPRFITGQFDSSVDVPTRQWEVVKDDMLGRYRRD